MKNHLLVLFLAFYLTSTAQDKITFDYDAAGNQIKRELCLTCNKPNYKNTAPKEVADLQKEDLQKFLPEDTFSYYPNPVKEELYLQWETQNKAINTIYLYNLNGQLLRTFDQLEKAKTLNIPFFNYTQGTYLIVMHYSDGEQKTIKIVK